MSILDSFLRSRNSSPNGEMSFVDHIEELRWHLIRSIVVLLIVSIVAFVFIEWIFAHIVMGPASSDFVTYRWLCELGNALHTKELCMGDVKVQFQSNVMSGQFMMAFSSSFMIGFIVSFPYIFWEFWKFVKPALKPSELKYARGIVFWCSTLFLMGVLFAYYLIAPFTINFFASYQLSPQIENKFTISDYYDTMSDLILGLGIVFELPVVVYFLSRIGILTPKLMRNQRRYAILIIFILAAVITPPDMFSIWLVAIPLLILYQVSIAICERTTKARAKRQALKENF